MNDQRQGSPHTRIGRRRFLAALGTGLALPPSAIYAAAALDLGMAFVNFTPSVCSTFGM